jgi:hypothetical protein
MKKKFLIFILQFMFLVGNDCFAQAISTEQKFLDWTVFKTQRGRAIVCYMVAMPINKVIIENNKSQDKKVKRPEILPYFLVANIKDSPDEISVYSGFNYKKDSEVKVSFASKSFYLFPYISTAWANDRDEDATIIKELQKNDQMTIISYSDQDYSTIDTYSLIGFSLAYKKMNEICANND